MATMTVTSNNLNEIIEKNNTVIIDFWASWCGPCRSFKPIFEAAAERHGDVVFASCDTEAESDVAAAFGIRSIPTVAIFREKILVFMQPAMLPAEALEQLLTQVAALDMEVVRAEVAKQQETPSAVA